MCVCVCVCVCVCLCVCIVLVNLPRWVHARRTGAVDIQLPQPACHVYFIYTTYRFTCLLVLQYKLVLKYKY